MIARPHGNPSVHLMQQPQHKTPQTKNGTWLTKLQSLHVEQRAFSFILIMGVLGAVFGAITTDLELQGCMKSWDCFLSNPAQQRLEGIEKGAFAGIVTALVLSLPAIIKE